MLPVLSGGSSRRRVLRTSPRTLCDGVRVVLQVSTRVLNDVASSIGRARGPRFPRSTVAMPGVRSLAPEDVDARTPTRSARRCTDDAASPRARGLAQGARSTPTPYSAVARAATYGGGNVVQSTRRHLEGHPYSAAERARRCAEDATSRATARTELAAWPDCPVSHGVAASSAGRVLRASPRAPPLPRALWRSTGGRVLRARLLRA